MAVMEIALPSGFIFERESLDAIRSSVCAVKQTETQKSGTVALLYFESIGNDELKIPLRTLQTVVVQQLKPALMSVYDYYDSCE